MNLLLKRRALMQQASGSIPILPSEYQRVEWIKSSGSQYINTGVIINSNSGMEIEAEWEYTNNTALMGAGSANNVRDYGFGTWNNYLLFQYNGTLAVTFSSAKTVYSAINGKFYLNGEFKKEKDASFDINLTAYVFWAHLASVAGWAANKARAKVYYAKIMNNTGETQCHLIPCYRKSDSEIGMYDVISDTFFTNSGTGTFTKGADV